MSINTIEDLQADFELLDDWEERYRYVIELGRLLPDLDEKWRIPLYKVSGCASQVWIHADRNGDVLNFTGDSDALIVKGLIAIAFMIYSGQTAQAILTTDAGPILDELGLSSHLTQQRSNGFAAMIQRIKADARAALQDSPAAGMAGR